ncbi:SurA N-terminal domain-containing protein [Rhodoligotrophos defluvii]|uniref:SurA N-terminal domain-containing protein n=1 Tax=Rhodoligotrophos defluvii TaxID=2561934 RepID=UPI0014856F67|nr:SurA N-terminal domain-containing protein [Rhodoligotrophos defluvii]
MRSKVAGWVAKAFIGLIAMSFAVWGVADMFTGPRNRALATVGDREISQEQFQDTMQQRLRMMSQRLGRPISVQEARQSGFDLQVLNDLIRQTALEVQARNLGLEVPDLAVAQRVAQIPAFRNAQGQFDRSTFLQVLRANNLTEQQFIAIERADLLREAVASTIDRNFKVPETLVRAAHEFQNTERSGKYLTLPLAMAGDVPPPTDQEIQAYYEDHKRTFTAPEFRTLTVVRLEPADIADQVTISDAQLEQAYKQRIAEFTTPERRTVLQIPFKDEAEAKAARAQLQTGADFETFARERGLTEADYSLGTVTKNQIPDESLADAAFSLQPGQISQPVEGRLAVVLLKVTNVEPSVVKPLAEVRDQLLQTLKLEHAREEIAAMYDRFEDERASGLSLREAAEKLDLPVLQVDAIDRSGNGPDGKPVANVPVRDKLVAAAFDSDVGVENDAIATDDEGYVWFEVVEVTPEAVKPLDEVRTEIIGLISAERRREALEQKARDLAAELRDGTKTMEQLAQELSVPVATTPLLKRTGEVPNFGKPAVASLFSTPIGGAGVAFDPASNVAQIIRPTEAKLPEFDPDGAQAKAFAQALRGSMAEDLFGQYVSSLEREIGVTVNNELWSSITAPQS